MNRLALCAGSLALLTWTAGCGDLLSTGNTDSSGTQVAQNGAGGGGAPTGATGAPQGMNMSAPPSGMNSGGPGGMDPSTDPAAMGNMTGEPGGAGVDPAMMDPSTMDPRMRGNYGANSGGVGGPDAVGLDPAQEGMEQQMEMQRRMREQAAAGGAGAAGANGFPAGFRPEDNVPGAELDPRMQAGALDPRMQAGAAGLEGGPGGPGGGGRGNTPDFDEGTAENALQQVVLKTTAGDLKGLKKYITDDAEGILGDLRSGEISAARLKEAQDMMAQVSLSGRPRQSGRVKTINLKNGSNRILSFECERQKGGIYLVAKLTVRDSTNSKRVR